MKAKRYMYRNLRTGAFSVKRKGIVVKRGNLFTMNNVDFKVNEVGRNRVLETKQKNVHAYIVAKRVHTPAMNEWCAEDMANAGGYKQVSYNPYEGPYFFVVSTKEPIYKARHVICVAGKVYAI